MNPLVVFAAPYAKVGSFAVIGVVGAVMLYAVTFTGGEIVTFAVAAITVAGGVFANFMANRARKYEKKLEREESEIERLRADVDRSRTDAKDHRDRMHALYEHNERLHVENTRVWVAARILEGQLIEADLIPDIGLERPDAS